MVLSIIEHQWLFFIISEIIFWVTLIAFFVLRYVLHFRLGSFVALVMLVLNELWVACLALINYSYTGKLSTFSIVMIAILVYTFTWGRHDAKKLDIYIQRLVAKWRNEEVPQAVKEYDQKRLYGIAYAKKQFKSWLIHLLLFICIQLFFYFSSGLSEPGFLYKNESYNQINAVWMKIFIIDTIWSLSYFIFPKKPRKQV
ncbi:hypothetical protein SAMN05444392_10353 [Seinonella peptonophila]|uniref:Integral membrane protein n=1 Tax=Seinonella peptonophila TaxID=112248 RepID=A0A1M4W627_9BACL|nr:hypothetical protein [Seinonella peptonophila]SHE76657.1 hypothetical protein SAMN05444392_10353 [Seinonella peptonophila]